MKKIVSLSIFFILFFQNSVNADKLKAKAWLNTEITKIIELYKDENTPIEIRLDAIEEAINKSFAGTGIARFVVGKIWEQSTELEQQRFVTLFKEHLYLTIGSLMQGYSNQNFQLIDSHEDKNQGVYLIDMEIEHSDQKTEVTWRVKKAKNKYYVIDLLVADISLVITKRAEFNSMLNKVNNDLSELNLLLIKQNSESYNNLIN